MKPLLITSLITLCILTSCDRFEYHPYSVNLDGPHDINTANLEILEQSRLTLPYKFAFITDTQGSLDETREALDIIASRNDVDFIIHGGDITDFGLPKEYLWTRDLMEKCRKPYLTVIGNHDCLGNGEDTFNYLFGPQNFSLNVAHTHIVCLNTVALEYDYSHPVPDLLFIEDDINRVNEINREHPDSITRTIVAMHSRPYDEQFNNNVAKAFNLYISNYPGMKESPDAKPTGFCVNGHNHSHEVTDIFGNGILYYQCPDMGKRQFFIFTVTKEGHDYEVVEF